MSIELDVPAYRQESPMSCWWAATQMIFQYRGRRLYPKPWDFDERFRPPPSISHHPAIYAYGTPSSPTLDDLARDGGGRALTQPPFMWFERGLPGTQSAFDLYCQITGMRGLASRPGWGSWTDGLIESTLRQYGPFMFLGFWRNSGHAIVVRGVRQSGTSATVLINDPAPDVLRSELSLADFNARMNRPAMRQCSGLRQNPMYLPI